MSINESYDVVVLGGGPAGSAAAITLAREGRRVLLAEAVANTAFKIGETLPPSTYPLLHDIGVASRVAAGRHLPCPGTVAVWGSDRPAESDFIREVHGSGWHLDRLRFDADLRAAAADAGAEVRLDCSFAGWRRTADDQWGLQFASRGKALHVSTSWVIDATGRRALFASAQGAVSQRDDALVAFCVVASAAGCGLDARTYIESSPDGWWYSALLSGGRRVVAFFSDDDLPAAVEIARAAGFARRLAGTQYLRQIVNELPATSISGVRRFTASSVSRKIFSGPGWIAVGDASLAFDPLSSQGIFHGLYTGLHGAQTVMSAMAGDALALPSWQERIQEIHTVYQRHLAQCYGAEARWPKAPFWLRRQSGARETNARSGEFPAPVGAMDRRAPSSADVV